MNRIAFTWLKYATCVAGVLLIPYAAQAFSFGAPVIKSHLDEPLRIHLPISLNNGEVLSQIFIDLAKPDVYKQWGLQPYMDVSQLHLVVHDEQKNHPYVEIFSYHPMSMALISFILEAKERQHHYYKQIKVMLDPASFSSSKNHYTQHEEVMHLPVQKSRKKPVKTRIKAVKPVYVSDVGWARTWRYGPVRSGDSLSTIAYRLRKDKRYSNHAVMRALYRLNPDAFDHADINHLKSGVFLNVPHAEQLKILLSESFAPSAVKKSTIPILEPIRVKQAPKLHYVGHISAKITPKTVSKSKLTLKQATMIEDVAAVKKRLNAMYKKSMAAHIRMDGVDLALAKVNAKVNGLKHEVKQVNQNQLALQIQVDQLSSQYDNPWIWRWGLLLLLMLNAVGLGFLYLRLKKKPVDVLEEDFVDKKYSGVRSDSNNESLVINSIENHTYDIERAIDHKDYTLAQSILDRLQGGQVYNPRLSALKVCLYHAMDQVEKRDSYVRQKHDDLNEMQWRVFCDRIPSDVWQALVLAHVVAGLSYDDDMESRVRDIDDTVVQNPPHLIVDNENPEQTFESMEDIGFDGIPTVTDRTEKNNTPEVKKISDDALSSEKTFFTQMDEENKLSEFLMEEGEDNLAMVSEPYEATNSIENQEALDFNFADLSLEDNVEDRAIESALVQSDVDGIASDLSVIPMLEEESTSKVMENEGFIFEFDEEPLPMDDSHAVAVEKLHDLETAVAERDDLFVNQNFLSKNENMHDNEGKVL